jgi:SP family arabinose:H+ symporter-like MFS transporter
MALNGTLVKSTVVAALGGLLFGFDTAVIAGATSQLTRAFDLTPRGLGFTVSIALWGTVLGALLASIPGDRFGRRDSLRVLAVLYLVSALGCAFAPTWLLLVVARFIGGLAIGGSSVLGPMYIAEIAPAKWRGRLVGFFQFNVVAGILLAYFSNYVVGLTHGGAAEWRWKLGVSAVPAAFFFLMLFRIPRSPRWLAMKGRTTEARDVLEQIGEENIDAELEAMASALRLEQQQGKERLFSVRTRFPVFLAVSIAMFNQLSGINAIDRGNQPAVHHAGHVDH